MILIKKADVPHLYKNDFFSYITFLHVNELNVEQPLFKLQLNKIKHNIKINISTRTHVHSFMHCISSWPYWR